VICSDHLIYPRELSSPYPDSPTGRPGWAPETAWPDSWVLIGAMAAVTERLRFSNAVYVAPARPLIEVAKQIATASVLSEGRVSLGVGVGWMREEYELLGQDFDTRGKRLNEMIPALRELWRGGWVSWSGEYYQVPELMIEPHPDASIPILCGGESDAALRRAARMCDGWVGYAYPWDDAVGYAEKLKKLRREYGRENEPFDILLALVEPPTPDLYKRAEDVGITQVMSAPWMGMDLPPGGVERYREPIERFAETIIAKVRR
jgi:probable F420-dependent oxidoreductase